MSYENHYSIKLSSALFCSVLEYSTAGTRSTRVIALPVKHPWTFPALGHTAPGLPTPYKPHTPPFGHVLALYIGHYVFMYFAPSFLRSAAADTARIRESTYRRSWGLMYLMLSEAVG